MNINGVSDWNKVDASLFSQGVNRMRIEKEIYFLKPKTLAYTTEHGETNDAIT